MQGFMRVARQQRHWSRRHGRHAPVTHLHTRAGRRAPRLAGWIAQALVRVGEDGVEGLDGRWRCPAFGGGELRRRAAAGCCHPDPSWERAPIQIEGKHPKPDRVPPGLCVEVSVATCVKGEQQHHGGWLAVLHPVSGY